VTRFLGNAVVALFGVAVVWILFPLRDVTRAAGRVLDAGYAAAYWAADTATAAWARLHRRR
jgi:hypothetical protein